MAALAFLSPSVTPFNDAIVDLEPAVITLKNLLIAVVAVNVAITFNKLVAMPRIESFSANFVAICKPSFRAAMTVTTPSLPPATVFRNSAHEFLRLAALN